MPRQDIQLAERQVTVSDDDALPRSLATWAVLRTRALDELTLQAPRVPVRVVTPLEHTPAPQARVLRRMVSRSLEGGVCGLAARVADVATALTRPGEFMARIEASGYLPRELTSAIDDARRTVGASAAGVTALNIAPPDPLPVAPLPTTARQQFSPGRGVLIERPVTSVDEEFTQVPHTAPASATDLPISPPLATNRLAGTHVAGVPIHLSDQLLHRADVARLQGRIQQRLIGPPATLVPAVGAQIGILGYWPNYPAMATTAALPLDFCAVPASLPMAHAVGAVVQRCAVLPAGAPQRLLNAAPAGARSLLLASAVGLNVLGGDVLSLDVGTSPEQEFVVTSNVVLGADPIGPALVNLRSVLGTLHRTGAAVQRVTVAGFMAAGLVSREALPGDAVLFCSGLLPLPISGVLAIEHGTPRAAYVRYQQLPRAMPLPAPPLNNFALTNTVTVDSQGRFEWPAIARVAQLEIAVMYGGLSVAPLRFAISYDSANLLSILVS